MPEYSTKPETSEVPGIPSGYPEYTSSTEEPSPRPQVIITETPIYPGPESTSHETYIPPETTGYPTPGYSEQSGSPETPSYTSQGTGKRSFLQLYNQLHHTDVTLLNLFSYRIRDYFHNRILRSRTLSYN